MRICIYCEPLRTATSGTPMRAMIRELLRLRKNDRFLLTVRKGYEQDRILTAFIDSLKEFTNWELVVDHMPRKLSNVLGLLRYGNYCRVKVDADIYLNPDCNSLGSKAHPLIVTIHDLSSFSPLQFTSYGSRWQLWLRRFMIRNGIASAEKVVSISAFTKEDIVRTFGTKSEKIPVIYNGINQEWISQPIVDDAKSSPGYWIWWGMITHRKNLHGLVTAYASLIKSAPERPVPMLKLVYSNQAFPESLQQLISSEGLTGKVILEKSQPLDKLIDNVSGSCGLLFPSLIEGFGMPVVEAFARGVPVLTSNTSSLQEIAGGLAVMVDPAETSTILEGLREMMELTTEEPENANNRKQHALQFTPERAAQKYGLLIDELYDKRIS
ncbi:glycosyltransferase family 4 protein [Pseudoflavitalea rhizosphaerae]|uniref:glycosyltransferase family 4 protein n=1 Tax=Pseudoflavitalea rhizosphaerae TaxID=1884793 RepID=UPI000F8E361C|nr:glycosyltransferase family 1 protein [Pseudoflavitalea rhizosphaerae]